MLAIFGEITFEALTSPRAMSHAYRWKYAIQPVIENRPKLQWIADELSTISLEMLFHRSFTKPTLQVERLLTAASDHHARPLVFGNGDFQGYFVVTAASTTYEQLSADGDVVAIAMRAELLEWDFSGSVSAASVATAFAPLAAVVAAPGGATGTISASPAAGVTSDTLPIEQGYSELQLPEAGISSLLRLSAVESSLPNQLIPADISAFQIVRAGV